MNEFEKQVIKELKAIRREAANIAGWMMPMFVFLMMIWMHGCK